MKKQLYAAAAVATLLAPHVVQAQQAAPSTGVQQPDAQLKAELNSLYQKVKELSDYAVTEAKLAYYKQQVGAAYFTALAKGENPTTVKTQLEAATKKPLATFKAEVEEDYAKARANLIFGVKSVLPPKLAEEFNNFASNSSKTIMELQAFGKQLIAKQEEEAKLAEAKKQAIAEIGQMNELPNAIKNQYYTKVNNATTMEAIEMVKQEAAQDVATRKQIAAKKAEAEKILKSKNDLDVGERSDYLTRLENAGTESEIDSILKEAEATAAANKVVFDKRQSVSDTIEKLRYLPKEQKVDFKGRLEHLQTVNQLEAVLQKAKKANVQALKDEEKSNT
ncbi:hypothetical protein BU202_00495 [Streptococcus cuniculi]|uniref:Protein G-related albumin-binding (GA) module domain-containing protein n=1 Tax=Streptococcus cuniculi TaxID=1432788 RepID=A0A1Q8EAJ2_9STRE|nr:GA module-containing protein [Streptococcus cuniculi]OLF48804.1 hypothetical protein BU202_00495 [Streptococcus cuniculi]